MTVSMEMVRMAKSRPSKNQWQDARISLKTTLPYNDVDYLFAYLFIYLFVYLLKEVK